MNEPSDEPIELVLGRFDTHGITRALVGRQWIEVEHGIPGERVAATLTTGKRQQGRIVEVLEAAEDRTEPPCPYFRDWKCGGCQWQQITYEGQLRRKRDATDNEMRRAGIEARVTRTHTGEPWRYRSTAGISLGRHAGFRRRASLAIVPIHDCPISHSFIGELMAGLNDAIDTGMIPDFRGRVRLDVRLVETPEGHGLQVMVRPDLHRRPPREDVDALVTLLLAMPSVSGVALTLITGEVDAMKGDLFGTIEVAGRPVQLASGTFFQTNIGLLSILIGRLREEAGDLKGKRLGDIYGGVGVFGLFLSETARDVAVVESDPLALEAGKRTAADWGVQNVRFITGRAEDVLEGDGPYDVVVVDPPRTGLSEQVVTLLSEGRPERILYVSCLPQSLARDLAALITAGYRVESLELFDFYPQTYHVELLAVLMRS